MTRHPARAGLAVTIGAASVISVAALPVTPGAAPVDRGREWSEPAREIRYPARGEPRRLVVLLHGYGGLADDLDGLARTLAADNPDDEMVLLDGPAPAAGGAGRQWWDVRDRSDEARARSLAVAGDGLRTWLDGALADRGLSRHDAILIGFSQGAALALWVGARWNVGGVVAYAGRPVDLPPGPVSSPFLLVVGGRDPLISATAVQAFATELRARGALVDVQVHPELGHGLDHRAVVETRAFLRLPRPAAP